MKNKKQKYKIVEHKWKKVGEEPQCAYSIWRKRCFWWKLYGIRQSAIFDEHRLPMIMFASIEEALKAIEGWHFRIYDKTFNEEYSTESVVKEIEFEIGK